MSDLATQQAALVSALVAGSAVPAGFDKRRITATRNALLRKRAGEVASAWPLLAASYGAEWPTAFATWAASHPPMGSLRDGWDFARWAADSLPPLASDELSTRERQFTYDGRSAPRRRRLSALRHLFERRHPNPRR
jgi:hypothetical protein